MSQTLADVTIGVITALPKEFAIAWTLIGCPDDCAADGSGAGRTYKLGRVPSIFGGEHVVAVTQCVDMGNNSAAIRATQLLQHCPNVQHIIMCGIAGAVPNHKKAAGHVRLGDLVVSDRKGIIQYDLVKESPKEVEYRNPPRAPSATLLDALNRLESEAVLGRRPWDDILAAFLAGSSGKPWRRPRKLDRLHEWIDDLATPVSHPSDPDRIAGRPRVFRGPIASANKLLKSSRVRDALRDRFDVRAVEMEGSGIADATWACERLGYLVVRGTCDYCDPEKGDHWQLYAAAIAAAFTRALISATPVDKPLVVASAREIAREVVREMATGGFAGIVVPPAPASTTPSAYADAPMPATSESVKALETTLPPPVSSNVSQAALVGPAPLASDRRIFSEAAISHRERINDALQQLEFERAVELGALALEWLEVYHDRAESHAVANLYITLAGLASVRAKVDKPSGATHLEQAVEFLKRARVLCA
jgi:nucleoside phosphorylase